MNLSDLIAINLRLAPVPSLPAAIVARQHLISAERQGAASGERAHKSYGEDFRQKVLAMLRDTGPGTALDLAVCLGVTSQLLRKHLERLERDGLVARKARVSCGRAAYDWHATRIDHA